MNCDKGTWLVTSLQPVETLNKMNMGNNNNYCWPYNFDNLAMIVGT